MIIFTKKEFVDLLYKCLDTNNIYVNGGFGVNLSIPSQVERYTTNNEYNREHADEIKACAEKGHGWGWDCICLIKSLLWGFNFNEKEKYGGAKYKSNGIDDYSTSGFFKHCCYGQKWIEKTDVIPEGAILWTEGHIAVSIGNGLVIESTRYGGAKVRIAGIRGIYKGKDYPLRTFDKWGYCQFILYEDRKKGDINGDGKIDARDYALCKRIVLKTFEPDDVQRWAADINGDGKVSAMDYLRLKRMVLKK